MIKKICCIVLIILFIILKCLTIQAAVATSDLILSNNTVKLGDSFTVTLKINCADGINGVTGLQYTYNDKVLELVTSGVNDTNFVNIGSNTSIDLICNSTSKITTSNIYKFTFKVKENITNISETEISFSKFNVDSDAQNNSKIEIESKKVKITIAPNKENNQNIQDENIIENNTIKPVTNTKKKKKGNNSNKTTNKTNNQVNNTTKDTSSNKKSNSTTNNSNKKENIKTIKELPKTGVTTGIGIAVLVTIGIAIYYYNKYNNIKK